MKPLTRIAAWVWIGTIPIGLAQLAYVYLHRGAFPPGAPWTPSPAWAAGEVAWVAFLLLCAVSLLRGRRWAWWVGVVFFGLGTLDLPFAAWRVLSGKDAWRPGWMVVDSLAVSVLGLFILVALLLDRPQPAEPREQAGTGETPVPPGD